MAKLFEEIESGDIGQVWKLVNDGAPLDQVDDTTGMTALALAAESGSLEIVQILLEADANPNQGGSTTPLEAAVVEGHVEVAKALIEASADVNRPVEDSFTPLMTAAATGSIKLVRLLLQAGARPRAKNDLGDTAISLAEAEGHDVIARSLRQWRRPKISTVSTIEPRETPPMIVKTAELPETVEPPEKPETEQTGDARENPLCSDEPGDPFTSGPLTDVSQEWTLVAEPLTKTADSSTAETLAWFLGVPDPITSSTAAGWPAHSQGAPPLAPAEARDGDEVDVFTKLRRLIRDGDDNAIAHLLEHGKLGIDDRDSEGRTPLMLAAAAGEPQIVRSLIGAGARLDLTDSSPSGASALIAAIRSTSDLRRQTFQALTTAGADVNQACGLNRWTPLMHAAEADIDMEPEDEPYFGSMTKALIALGAELESRDHRGYTVWRQTKRKALGARTSSSHRGRLHLLLRILEHAGAQQIAKHLV